MLRQSERRLCICHLERDVHKFIFISMAKVDTSGALHHA